MKPKKSEIIWDLTKGIAICTIVALFAYGVLNPFLVAIFYPDDPPGQRDFTPLYYCIQLIYTVTFYCIYIRKSGDDGTPKSLDKFVPLEDLKEYIIGDGKILIIFYAAMLVLYTIGNEFLPIGNPLTFIFCFPFSMSENIQIPFLGEIVAYIVEMALILLLTVYQHYRNFKYWNKKKF